MQKTAYEMRISDWSSDVCSSDLDGIDARGHAGRAHGRHHRLGAGLVLRAEKDAGELLLMLAVAGPAVDHRLDPGAGAGERFAGEAHGRISFRRSKIGRASCRERVCQYG